LNAKKSSKTDVAFKPEKYKILFPYELPLK